MPTSVVRKDDLAASEMSFGSITWFVSGDAGTSDTLTVGRLVLKHGGANPMHIHPNCDEVVHVLSGAIRHSMEEGRTVDMTAGDTISVPAGVPHNAENIGEDDAVCMICFSTSRREAVNV